MHQGILKRLEVAAELPGDGNLGSWRGRDASTAPERRSACSGLLSMTCWRESEESQVGNLRTNIHGSEKAMTLSPGGLPIMPPPKASTTTYCLPFFPW